MKKSFLWLTSLLLFSSFTLLFTACDDDDDMPEPVSQTIVDFASADPNFSILVDAVVKAELDGVLSGDGPFTVFAPTNDAFQAFLDAAGTNTIANTPKDVLVAVLTNHVLSGKALSSGLSTGYYSTLSATGFGDATTSLFIEVNNGVKINGTSTVISADNEVDNGVIHAVDEVIGLPTVVTLAVANPNFSSLVAALTRPDLTIDFVSVLSGAGPFTVFAPTNDAFQALLDSNPSWNSLNDVPVDLLQAVLLYHVTDAGNVRAADLTNGQQVTTLSNGETFTINLDGPTIVAGSNSAKIIATDVQAANGVIHAIDTVILPE
ncbi:MAG: fasciclin domain-containing protein [Phaeodactylibacter sp.]|nr:fasciclin domain-containing protein [Phaeodactylibacter sp.]MCB9299152.1 fasciclin domain-containing protein [Lewinellaceae bacterium]